MFPLKFPVGRIFGSILGFLAFTGRMIGNNGLWIAAHAKGENLTLVTNNIHEFKRIPELKVENRD